MSTFFPETQLASAILKMALHDIQQFPNPPSSPENAQQAVFLHHCISAYEFFYDPDPCFPLLILELNLSMECFLSHVPHPTAESYILARRLLTDFLFTYSKTYTRKSHPEIDTLIAYYFTERIAA